MVSVWGAKLTGKNITALLRPQSSIEASVARGYGTVTFKVEVFPRPLCPWDIETSFLAALYWCRRDTPDIGTSTNQGDKVKVYLTLSSRVRRARSFRELLVIAAE